MHISIICIPYQIDVTRWGVALGPQAFLDHGLIQQLETKATQSLTPSGLNCPDQNACVIQSQTLGTLRNDHPQR